MTNISIHPMVSIYNNFAAQGDWSRAWYNYTNFINEGIKNPRARMLDIEIGKNILNKNAKYTKRILKETEGDDSACKFLNGYKKVFRKIFSKSKDGHPCVINAYKNLEKSFQEMYPSTKTQRLSRFILFKQRHHLLGRMKFIARFI